MLRGACIASALAVCLMTTGCGTSSPVVQDAKELEAFETAKDAYIYAYPLVTMELTRRVSTDVVCPKGFLPRWASSPSCANIQTLPSTL
jgi:hypothetical protein